MIRLARYLVQESGVGRQIFQGSVCEQASTIGVDQCLYLEDVFRANLLDTFLQPDGEEVLPPYGPDTLHAGAFPKLKNSKTDHMNDGHPYLYIRLYPDFCLDFDLRIHHHLLVQVVLLAHSDHDQAGEGIPVRLLFWKNSILHGDGESVIHLHTCLLFAGLVLSCLSKADVVQFRGFSARGEATLSPSLHLHRGQLSCYERKNSAVNSEEIGGDVHRHLSGQRKG